ncbi:hypothetical protein [Butyrivibrio sp. AE2032]|uniref:hypothetical protein n=1 Tax=Butyrivibrio sp. AE2032 TaxID=1458463 RepID=UPI0005539A6B|nr:hypothetical protein [Butyrivibrio sp. AE2032]
MSDIFITEIAVIAGCLMCFSGYKLFRLSLGIAGGVAGFVLGRFLINLTSELGIEWNGIAKTVILVLFTVGLGILAFKLYMKALIAVTTLICAFWFYDDFNFLFERMTNNALRIVVTLGAGLFAGFLIGVIVYYAQKWTISLFTAFVGARVISGVLAPVLWSAVSTGEYAGIVEKNMLGDGVGMSLSLVRVLVLVAFCAAGFAIQLKTAKK